MVIPIAVTVGLICFANFATNQFVQNATIVKTKVASNHIIVVATRRMRTNDEQMLSSSRKRPNR